MGLVTPTAGRVTVLGADMARERYRVLPRINFESPYVDMPHRLTVRQNLDLFDFELSPEQVDALSALDRGESAAVDSDDFGH